MSMTTNRRSFLFGASVAGFGVLVQGKRSLAWGVGPNETLNIACIGVGGKGEQRHASTPRGSAGSSPCATSTRIVWTRWRRKQKESKKYNDFRELLHELGDQDRRGGRLDARPHARPGRGHGDADGQARLLPEAAGALGLGSPADARDGPAKRGLHPDGQPGHGRFRASAARSSWCVPGPSAR